MARNADEAVAFLRRKLEESEARVAMLKGALAAQGVRGEPDLFWASGLTWTEAALVGFLFRAGRRFVAAETIIERLPARDHAVTREPKQVAVWVHGIRQKLGFDAIENWPGGGYRLGPDLRAALKKTLRAPKQTARARRQDTA